MYNFTKADKDHVLRIIGVPGVTVHIDAWSALLFEAYRFRTEIAKVDGRRMAETGTGSGRSPTSAVAESDLPNTPDLSTPLPSGSIER